MSFDSSLGRSLSMFKSMKSKVKVTLKAVKYAPFAAGVNGFHFGQDEDRVEFGRLPETIFPDETKDYQPEVYITYIKNIKEVELIRE